MDMKYNLKEVQIENKVAYYYDVAEYIKHIVGEGIIKEAWCYIDSMSKKAYDRPKAKERKLEDIICCCKIIDKKVEETGFFTFSVYERLEIELVNGNKFCIDMKTFSGMSAYGYVNLKKGKKNSYELYNGDAVISNIEI